MNDIRLAIEAAKLLGRWTQIAERHANGCSCCPGLGDVTMEQVEGSVVAWLRERHALLKDGRSVIALLRECISRRIEPRPEKLQPLFKDLDEALSHLESVQHGF